MKTMLWLIYILLMIQGYSPNLAQPDYLPYPTQITWSPNGNYIALSGFGLMQVYDTTNGSIILDLPVGERQVYRHDWSHDNSQLAYIDGNTLQVWDVASRSTVFESDTSQRYGLFLDLDWSSDSTTIITHHLAESNYVIFWNADTYKTSSPISVGASDRILLSPNGQYIALSYSTFGPRIFNLHDLETLIFRPKDENNALVYAWNNISSELAIGYGDGRIIIWDVVKQTPLRTLQTDTREGFFNLTWDEPDTMVVIRDNFVVQLWDAQTGEVLYETPLYTSFAAALSPYGGRLALSTLMLPSEPQTTTPIVLAEDTRQIFSNGLVQVVVPDPSPERLHAIAESCNAESALTDSLADLAAQLDTQGIPPACQADLLAIAEAIESK